MILRWLIVAAKQEWLADQLSTTTAGIVEIRQKGTDSRLSAGQLKFQAALAIGFLGRRDVKIHGRNFPGVGLVEDPQRSSDDGVILHFLGVLILENQNRAGRHRALRLRLRRVFPLTSLFIVLPVNLILALLFLRA